MPSKTHSDDVTQLFNLLSSISTKSSAADFAAAEDQLLRIEEELAEVASYPGRDAFYNLR